MTKELLPSPIGATSLTREAKNNVPKDKKEYPLDIHCEFLF